MLSWRRKWQKSCQIPLHLGTELFHNVLMNQLVSLPLFTFFYLHMIPSYVFYINYSLRNTTVCPWKLFINTNYSLATEPISYTTVNLQPWEVTIQKEWLNLCISGITFFVFSVKGPGNLHQKRQAIIWQCWERMLRYWGVR